jgi:glycosyltransferase involved in cell wall biosynthesis
MTIGIDARTLSTRNITGVGKYVLRLVERISEQHSIVLFSDSPLQHQILQKKNITSAVLPSRHRWTWELFQLPTLLRQHPVDLYHATWNYGVPKHVPTVTTIHDLIPLALPAIYQTNVREKITTQIIKFFTARALRRSKKIISVSHATALDIHRFFGTPLSSIAVIHEGIDGLPSTSESPASDGTRNVAGKFVYFGGFERRKNIPFLVDAFVELQRTHPTATLVLVGEHNDYFNKNVVPRLTSSMSAPGYLPWSELQQTISTATAVVYPSFYEGFGFPVLEAMSSGVPVISSNVSSLPEICGDAAVLCDPTDSQSFVDAMKKVIEDPSYRSSLIGKGCQRVQQFSWDRMASETEKLYSSIVPS